MKLDIYVNYRGTCEEAFRFYEQHLGGKIVMMMRHNEVPGGQPMPPDFRNKILHAHLELGDTVLMGADIPNAEPMRSAYLAISPDSDADADRIYAALTQGGDIFMKMQETFFATRFAMFRDRFGASWMISRNKPRQ